MAVRRTLTTQSLAVPAHVLKNGGGNNNNAGDGFTAQLADVDILARLSERNPYVPKRHGRPNSDPGLWDIDSIR